MLTSQEDLQLIGCMISSENLIKWTSDEWKHHMDTLFKHYLSKSWLGLDWFPLKCHIIAVRFNREEEEEEEEGGSFSVAHSRPAK